MSQKHRSRGNHTRMWHVAQAGGIVLTLALLCGLVLTPEAALTALWSIAIPLLPATFLISPMVWRNVCPLTTLNMLPGQAGRRRVLPAASVPNASMVGVLLLAVLVPARRFLFNTDGMALAVTIAGVAVLALASGFFYDAKAGFCASICPVLPVERLYGQAPLTKVRHVRCPSCSSCVEHACMDLHPGHHLAHVLGTGPVGPSWLKTGFGSFAAAFPGFVFGYWMTADGPFASAAGVYGTVASYSVVSWVLVAAVAMAARPDARAALPLLGAAAVGLYYWFAGPAIATDLELPEAAGIVLRAIGVTAVSLWLLSTLSKRERHGAGR